MDEWLKFRAQQYRSGLKLTLLPASRKIDGFEGDPVSSPERPSSQNAHAEPLLSISAETFFLPFYLSLRPKATTKKEKAIIQNPVYFPFHLSCIILLLTVPFWGPERIVVLAGEEPLGECLEVKLRDQTQQHSFGF